MALPMKNCLQVYLFLCLLNFPAVKLSLRKDVSRFLHIIKGFAIKFRKKLIFAHHYLYAHSWIININTSIQSNIKFWKNFSFHRLKKFRKISQWNVNRISLVTPGYILSRAPAILNLEYTSKTKTYPMML